MFGIRKEIDTRGMMFQTEHSYPDDEVHANRHHNSNASMDDTTLHDPDSPMNIGRMLGGVSDDEESPGKFKQKYRDEQFAINDAQSVRFTAYTMDTKNIVNELRNVGVTVLSLESLSTTAMIDYMDAVTSIRLGEANDEKCMLYTDRMGRVFNVIISGGAEGLAKAWSSIEASYSGLLAVTVIPFLISVITSYETNDKPMAIQPIALLLAFGLILQNETSMIWLSMSISVRGYNSVGSHVWRNGDLSDYPRLILLIILMLATIASEASDQGVAKALTLAGSTIGCLVLLSSLGSRAWKKADLGFIDTDNFFTPIVAIAASLTAGVCFPQMALRSVHSGTDDNDGNIDVEKILFHSDGKRARQNVTLASFATAAVYLCSKIQEVRDSLGFQDLPQSRSGALDFSIGLWIFLSTIVSMSLCHRIDSSASKKIEPFLRREETSPVGWIVPSIPHIVIDPNLSKGKMILPCLSFGSDIICTTFIGAAAFLIVWMGIKEIQGQPIAAFWQVFG